MINIFRHNSLISPDSTARDVFEIYDFDSLTEFAGGKFWLWGIEIEITLDWLLDGIDTSTREFIFPSSRDGLSLRF
ncbi:MAG: hypothetical protein CL791_03565 [Chloroflexi bacterium]|nr:hypothetical protein [Chloroflexota bacterium]